MSQKSTQRDRNTNEVNQLDELLQKYSPYKDFEDEADRERRLKAMMENAENFNVAQAQNKQHLRAISFGNSISLAKTQSLH